MKPRYRLLMCRTLGGVFWENPEWWVQALNDEARGMTGIPLYTRFL